MIPTRPSCLFCDSKAWDGNPYKYYECGMKKNALFQKQTNECKRREVALLVKKELQNLKNQ